MSYCVSFLPEDVNGGLTRLPPAVAGSGVSSFVPIQTIANCMAIEVMLLPQLMLKILINR